MVVRKAQIQNIIDNIVLGSFDVETYPNAMDAHSIAGANTTKYLVKPITNLFNGDQYQSMEFFEIKINTETEEQLETAIEALKTQSSKNGSGYFSGTKNLDLQLASYDKSGQIVFNGDMGGAQTIATQYTDFVSVDEDNSYDTSISVVNFTNAWWIFNSSIKGVTIKGVTINSAILKLKVEGTTLDTNIRLYGILDTNMEVFVESSVASLTTTYLTLNRTLIDDEVIEFDVKTILEEIMALSDYEGKNVAFVTNMREILEPAKSFSVYGFKSDDTPIESYRPNLEISYSYPTDYPFNVDFTLQSKSNIEPYEAVVLCKADWVV